MRTRGVSGLAAICGNVSLLSLPYSLSLPPSHFSFLFIFFNASFFPLPSPFLSSYRSPSLPALNSQLPRLTPSLIGYLRRSQRSRIIFMIHLPSMVLSFFSSSLLSSLISFLSPSPLPPDLQGIARDALKEFWRTQTDEWVFNQTKFTPSQIDSIQQSTIPSYFA